MPYFGNKYGIFFPIIFHKYSINLHELCILLLHITHTFLHFYAYFPPYLRTLPSTFTHIFLHFYAYFSPYLRTLSSTFMHDFLHIYAYFYARTRLCSIISKKNAFSMHIYGDYLPIFMHFVCIKSPYSMQLSGVLGVSPNKYAFCITNAYLANDTLCH